MYEPGSTSGLLMIILLIIIIAAFFVITSKLSKILDLLEFFKDIEQKRPDNWEHIKCKNCGKEFEISKALKGTFSCSNCNSTIRI
jgi:protein-arginine kinase activator protein McsA